MREAEEEALSARLFAIEFKLQQLERHLQSVDAGQLMQLSRQVELTCNEVIGLSAAQDRRHQDEALQAMFVARVTGAISATAAECASVRRALEQLASGLPTPLEPDRIDEQIVSIQRRMLAQIEKAELNDERMQELQRVPILGMSLPELQRLRESADTALSQSESLLKRAERLSKQDEVKLLRGQAAAQATVVDFLLASANSSPDGTIQLMDPAQLQAVLSSVSEQIRADAENRPSPSDLGALQQLAGQTRAEAERQQVMVEELVSLAGAPSDYEEKALTRAVDALESTLKETAEQLQGLQARASPGISEHPPASVVECVEACQKANVEATAALEGSKALQELHATQVSQVWEEIRRAQQQAARLDL